MPIGYGTPEGEPQAKFRLTNKRQPIRKELIPKSSLVRIFTSQRGGAQMLKNLYKFSSWVFWLPTIMAPKDRCGTLGTSNPSKQTTKTDRWRLTEYSPSEGPLWERRLSSSHRGLLNKSKLKDIGKNVIPCKSMKTTVSPDNSVWKR